MGGLVMAGWFLDFCGKGMPAGLRFYALQQTFTVNTDTRVHIVKLVESNWCLVSDGDLLMLALLLAHSTLVGTPASVRWY